MGKMGSGSKEGIIRERRGKVKLRTHKSCQKLAPSDKPGNPLICPWSGQKRGERATDVSCSIIAHRCIWLHV